MVRVGVPMGPQRQDRPDLAAGVCPPTKNSATATKDIYRSFVFGDLVTLYMLEDRTGAPVAPTTASPELPPPPPSCSGQHGSGPEAGVGGYASISVHLQKIRSPRQMFWLTPSSF